MVSNLPMLSVYNRRCKFTKNNFVIIRIENTRSGIQTIVAVRMCVEDLVLISICRTQAAHYSVIRCGSLLFHSFTISIDKFFSPLTNDFI